MILPLHHCDAIGCMRLTDPGELMCRAHWRQVGAKTMALLLVADTADKRFQAELLARGDVLLAEKGCNPFPGDPDYADEPPSPDASQEQPKPIPQPVPGDAGSPEKESNS